MNKEKLQEATILALQKEMLRENFDFEINDEFSTVTVNVAEYPNLDDGFKTLFKQSAAYGPVMEAGDKLINILKENNIYFDHAELAYISDEKFQMYMFFKTEQTKDITEKLDNAAAISAEVEKNNTKITYLWSTRNKDLILSENKPSEELIDAIIDYFNKISSSYETYMSTSRLEDTARYWFKYIAEAVIENSSKKSEFKSLNTKDRAKYIYNLYSSNFKDTLIKAILDIGKKL